MSIQITHNADGSITAECGGDELTFFPKQRTGKSAGASTSGSEPPIYMPPISSGERHRAYLYVPVGDDTDHGQISKSTPIIEWSSPSRFEADLGRLFDAKRSFGYSFPNQVRVMMQTGTKFEVQKIASAANRVAGVEPISLYLSRKLSGK